MSILIFGSNGQTGWELIRQCAAMDLTCKGFDLPEVDITQRNSIESVIEEDTKIIVNASAYTAVDKAESEPETAFAVNEAGPANLAAVCSDKGIPLIHISTDYVFDGTKSKPYVESDLTSPLGIYGKSKAAGEEAVRSRLERHIIIRTAWLCGVHGNNFVKTMIRLGRERDVVKVVDDQFGCPTFAFDLAEAILNVTKQYLAGKNFSWGAYHFCGKGTTTWYGFAEEIFRLVKKHFSLKIKPPVPIPTSEYPTPVSRPANSVLDCQKFEDQFGVRTKKWQESLAVMIDRLY